MTALYKCPGCGAEHLTAWDSHWHKKSCLDPDLPRKPAKKEKLLAQVWHDAEIIRELRDAGIDIPGLLREALNAAYKKL